MNKKLHFILILLINKKIDFFIYLHLFNKDFIVAILAQI
jgi:hypothetical protein